MRWLVDFVEVETGQAMSYQHTFGSVGTRNVRVEVSDGSASGGMVADEWMVTAEAPDGDGDGWRANADCNDANPAINPGAAEIIGNGIDDDCRPETQDGGSPPIASFYGSRRREGRRSAGSLHRHVAGSRTARSRRGRGISAMARPATSSIRRMSSPRPALSRSC